MIKDIIMTVQKKIKDHPDVMNSKNFHFIIHTLKNQKLNA